MRKNILDFNNMGFKYRDKTYFFNTITSIPQNVDVNVNRCEQDKCLGIPKCDIITYYFDIEFGNKKLRIENSNIVLFYTDEYKKVFFGLFKLRKVNDKIIGENWFNQYLKSNDFGHQKYIDWICQKTETIDTRLELEKCLKELQIKLNRYFEKLQNFSLKE